MKQNSFENSKKISDSQSGNLKQFIYRKNSKLSSVDYLKENSIDCIRKKGDDQPKTDCSDQASENSPEYSRQKERPHKKKVTLNSDRALNLVTGH